MFIGSHYDYTFIIIYKFDEVFQKATSSANDDHDEAVDDDDDDGVCCSDLVLISLTLNRASGNAMFKLILNRFCCCCCCFFFLFLFFNFVYAYIIRDFLVSFHFVALYFILHSMYAVVWC